MEQHSNVRKFLCDDLDQSGYTIVEYVWIGGHGDDLRSKCKTVKGEVTKVEQLSEWNYDGSSTAQAVTENSEVLMRPVALFRDPFRGGNNKIALCDTYHIDGRPTNTNFRHFAKKIFDKGVQEHDPWFGIEQEYVLMAAIGTGMQWPLGWPTGNFCQAQGQYYCSTGSQNNFGREIMNAHFKACLYAGVQIYGTNAEVMPGQWEFQVGNCKGIDIGDHLFMGRYLLERVAEYYNVTVNYGAKPIAGDWNGSGCHTNYSTNGTRNDGGMDVINAHMKKMEANHLTSISLYGPENHKRLTGMHETSSMKTFSCGKGNRAASVRIPRPTAETGKGYYEDRRPAGDIDPYVVGSSLFSITCLDNFGLTEMSDHYAAFIKNKK